MSPAGFNNDPRITPARPDIAADHLRGKVAAESYVEGRPARVTGEVVPLLGTPDIAAPISTQLLYGESFAVYDEGAGWAWGQAAADGYVGYVPADSLAAPVADITHHVAVPRTLIFSEPGLKSRCLGGLVMNSQISEAEAAKGYSRLATGGWVFSAHLSVSGEYSEDYVTVAERFIGTPYLWGGKSILGTDCSGLVQIAMHRAGLECPRDSDMQAASIGHERPIDPAGVRRGDLIFWKGHVGIVVAPDKLLHANAYHMGTYVELLSDAVARIGRSEGPVTAIRRPALGGG